MASTYAEERLEEKLFRVIIYVLIALSLFSITGNLIFGFPFHVNYKWLGMIVVGLFTLYAIHKDFYVTTVKKLLFIFLIYGIFPISWFDSGGSANNAIAYLFLLTICTTFFFHGKTRLVFILSLIVIFSTLLIIEYLYPQWIATHSEESQFMDRLLQIPLTVLAAYLFLRLFANAHQQERQRLDILSQLDPLTNIYNRRSFDALFDAFLSDFEDDRYLVFIDIDDFKDINDKQGHDTGDAVLNFLVEHVKRNIKKEDIFARWGGDEFILLFKGSLDELKHFLEKLHHFHYDLSTGATKITVDDTSLETVFKRVDEATYEIKEHGKGSYKIV